MKNLKEFKELIERYETIELVEIKAVFYEIYKPQKSLTGFGNISTCTLCISANVNCIKCVYGITVGCYDLNQEAKATYFAIRNSQTAKELLTAYRNRAKFMRELLKEKGVDDGTGS